MDRALNHLRVLKCLEARMAVVKGTKDASRRKAVRVIKATGGTDKIRCPGCQQMAVSIPDGMGGTKHRCTSCRREFKFQTLG